MATILRITLLSGRYGATPWDRSEFEGQVEYPPSPWRLLRAVLHGAFQLSEQRDKLPEGVAELVVALATHQPSYHFGKLSHKTLDLANWHVEYRVEGDFVALQRA